MTSKSFAEAMKTPAFARFVKRTKEAEKARKTLLDALIERAKEDNSDLYGAARSLTSMMPKQKQAEMHKALHDIIDKYREHVADEAMWPNGNRPK